MYIIHIFLNLKIKEAKSNNRKNRCIDEKLKEIMHKYTQGKSV